MYAGAKCLRYNVSGVEPCEWQPPSNTITRNRDNLVAISYYLPEREGKGRVETARWLHKSSCAELHNESQNLSPTGKELETPQLKGLHEREDWPVLSQF